MPVESRPITDRETWLEWRRKVVTASVVGALPAFSCHPYVTALKVFATLRGVEFPDDPDNKVLRRGRWLEAAFPKIISELRPEWTLELPNVFLVDSDWRLGATPDFYIRGDPRGLGILQAKTTAPSVYAREWASGEEVPFWIVLQALTEAMLSGANFAAVAVMVVDAFNLDVVIHEIPRHVGAEAKILAEVARFMREVDQGIEPEPDYERDTNVLKLLLPREVPGTSIDLSGNNDLPELLAERAELCARIMQHETRVEAINNRVKFLMGDAAMVEGIRDWGITFKVQHRKGYTVEPSTPRVLLIRDKRPPDQRPGWSEEDEQE